MIHPHTEPRQTRDGRGRGVFATQLIPRGTITWVLDPFDSCLSRAAVARLPPLLQAAVLREAYPGADERLVFCWDHGRHVNHSCQPSCADLGGSFQIAARTLRPGDELTCDYGECGHFVDFACSCGAPACRGWLPAGPPRAPSSTELETLLVLAAALPQPLLPFASPEPEDAHLLERFDPDRGERMGRVGAMR